MSMLLTPQAPGAACHERCRIGFHLRAGGPGRRLGIAAMSTLATPTIGLSLRLPIHHHPRPENLPVTGRALILVAVMLVHVAGLWVLHSGLLRRAVEVVIPVAVVAEVIESAQPQPVAPPPAPAPPTPALAPRPTPSAPAAPPKTATEQRQVPPSPVVTPTPSDLAPTVAAVAPNPPSPEPAAPSASSSPSTPAPPAPPAKPTIELPSSKAEYLNNPQPPYPQASKRLGEQGLVVVRTLIHTDGTAQRAEIKTSSGFERLDKLAVETVLKWRYVPGKRNGEPEAMWFDVPIHFQLR